MSNEVIKIGHQGDNNAYTWTHSIQKIISTYGEGGEFFCRIRRSGDIDSYPKECSLSGTDLVVIFNETDMRYIGLGELQYIYTVDDVVKCSDIFEFSVERSLGSGNSPEPWIEWIRKVEDNATRARTAADMAEEFAMSVTEMTVSAEELPEGSMPTVTKTIIEDVIHLLFGIPKSVFPQLFSWNNVIDKPNSYPPSSHSHDDLYYEKEHIDEHFQDSDIHITARERTVWNRFSEWVHHHSNKNVLDYISEESVDKWDTVTQKMDSKSVYNKEYIDRHFNNQDIHVDPLEAAAWTRAGQQTHTHGNKALLDSIPNAPSADGLYSLKCEVSESTKRYYWVAD